MKNSVLLKAFAAATDKEIYYFMGFLPDSAEQVFSFAATELRKFHGDITIKDILPVLVCFLSRFGGFGYYFPVLSLAGRNSIRKYLKAILCAEENIDALDRATEYWTGRQGGGLTYIENIKSFIRWFIESGDLSPKNIDIFIEILLGIFVLSSGKSVSIPLCKNLYSNIRDFIIRKEYTGKRGEVKSICMQYGISKTTAYEILFHRSGVK